MQHQEQMSDVPLEHLCVWFAAWDRLLTKAVYVAPWDVAVSPSDLEPDDDGAKPYDVIVRWVDQHSKEYVRWWFVSRTRYDNRLAAYKAAATLVRELLAMRVKRCNRRLELTSS